MDKSSSHSSSDRSIADLMLELENARTENARLKSVNGALVREVQELKQKACIGEIRKSDSGSSAVTPETSILGALTELSISISYCNSDLRYVWATHFLEGFTCKFMHGKHDDEIFPVETKGLEDFILLRKQALHSGISQVDYVQMDIPDHGSMTWLVMVKPCFNDRDNIPVGVLTTCLNIPLTRSDTQVCLQNRTTEYELREAVRLTEEAIRAKNMFLSIMSHEIRTPLNGLLGLAEALESSGLDKEQRELLTAIVSSGTIIADILGDILDLASMESGAMQLEAQPFSPASVVHEVVKMAVAATHEKGLDILAQVGSNVPELVIGDGLRVRQVMKYLVLNAIKFTQQGNVQIKMDSIPMMDTSGNQHLAIKKQVAAVRGQNDDSFQRVKSARPEGDFVLWCQIADTGVGIPKEAFATLFEHLSEANFSATINHGGTGLGLALCKQLVELMGGRLTVDSEVGRGSVFTFSVLCKSQPKGERDSVSVTKPLQSDPELKSAPYSRKEPRILLAEDNKVNVMVAISMLKRLGFTAQVVANGVEALEAMRKEKYDLVLLDICMPLMDGLQVAYAIRRYEQTGKWPDKIWDGLSNGEAHDSNPAAAKGGGVELSCALEGLRSSSRSLEGERTSGGAKRIPIIAVTANALRSDIERCFAHGMDAFIPKPVMFQKLREILAKYLPIQQQQQQQQ